MLASAMAATAAAADAQKGSKRPVDSAFRQQKMPAWQPILTPKWAILIFFGFGIVFVPLGVYFYFASASVNYVEIRYDHLSQCTLGSFCNVTFTPQRNFTAPVYFYYGLENFFQNHRRYVSSRSDPQLRGTNLTSVDQASACYPLDVMVPGTQNPALIRNPCGLIAASMFNDTFILTDPSNNTVPWTNQGIIWPSDTAKYAPPVGGFILAENGFPQVNATNPDFIVWMRTAGLPRFKKLHRIIQQDLVEHRTYTVTIYNQYPVYQFAGRKFIYLTTTTWLGGANDFLGIAYMAVGSLCILLGVAFLIKHAVAPRKLGDLQYLNFEG